MVSTPLIKDASELVRNSGMTIALTGAGISVESGIPDFRSAEGLWAKYDPSEYATIDAFRSNPEKVWMMLRDMDEIVRNARPNAAHIGLGELEKMGLLHHIITQNVDNLHQMGGAQNVIEYHGNSSTLSCLYCGKRYKADEKRKESTPYCECKRILKPDVILFGESIPEEALNQSFLLASSAQLLIIIGTSAVVSPANTLPMIAKKNQAKIIEINREETHLTGSMTTLFLKGNAGEIVPALVAEIKRAALH